MEAGKPNRWLSRSAGAALCLGLLVSADPVLAGPITFNTALPVARDTFVTRLQAIHRDDDVVDGSRVDNGGTEWRVVPGLQYVTRRWVVEAAVELPAGDDLPDTALRDDEFWHVGVRFNF
jgi:hypothetical protein